MDEATRTALTARIKDYARAIGFDGVGIARADPFDDDRRVTQGRIAAGHYSGLPWFTEERAAFASDPRNLLPTVHSIISLALAYEPPSRGATDGADGLRGRVSAYAWGRDYHHVLKERMEQVVAFIRDACGADQETRTLVDTARIVDRAAARRAGVGWVGKHTNVITKEAGSWVFLGEILTELDLEPDRPLRTNCGRCDLCMRACPTAAIIAPYEVDSNRCISYLTIEHRGPIPRELRPLMGNWIFGCDICQEVCPPNRSATRRTPGDDEDAATPDLAAPELIPLLSITPEEFAHRFGATPIKRAKREGLQRNVAIALGNSGDARAVPALVRALGEESRLVRMHAAWALGQIGGEEALAALRGALRRESDDETRREIALALDETTGG